MNQIVTDDLRLAVEFVFISLYLSFSVVILLQKCIAKFIGVKQRAYDSTFIGISLQFLLIFAVSIMQWRLLPDIISSNNTYRSSTHALLFLSMLALPTIYYCTKRRFNLTRINILFGLIFSTIVILNTLCIADLKYNIIKTEQIWQYGFIIILFTISILLITKIILYLKILTREFRVTGFGKIDHDEPFLYFAILMLSVVGFIVLYLNSTMHYFDIIFVYFLIMNSILFRKIVIIQRKILNSVVDEQNENRINSLFQINGESDLRERLIKYFEEKKPYLRKDLSLNEVSLYLYTNKTYLSKMINECLNMNFNQLVNSYRIREAKEIYRNNLNISMRDLCDMSGFGSMATFSVAFRLFAGSTPADWCKNERVNSNAS